jgi:predicted nuclease of predicted toxin-antitoxin system
MKFIIDAQLPRKLSAFLSEKGFDSIHTLDLPKKNKTSDSEINKISIEQKRILISKDSDFYNSYFQKVEPYKLIYLTTGNISTGELIEIFDKNYVKIFEEIQLNFVVEISKTSIITII